MADINKKHRERRRIAERMYKESVGFFGGWYNDPTSAIPDEWEDDYAYEVTYTPLFGESKEPRTYMSKMGVQHDIMADISQEDYFWLEEKAREEGVRNYYKEDRASKNHGRSEKEYRAIYHRKRRRKEKELCRQLMYEGETFRTARLEGEIKSCAYGIDWDIW